MAGSDGPAVAGGPARHVPVLARPALELLNVRDGGIYIDGTFGAGGYSRAILAAANAQVIGIDRDQNAVASGAGLVQSANGRLTLVEERFSALDRAAEKFGHAAVDGIVLDLGVSSMQLDDPARGFTFKTDSALDLRLNPTRAPSAADWLARVSAATLASALTENADEPHAELLARELTARQKNRPVTRTLQLAESIRTILHQHKPHRDPAADDDCVRRVFQAIRIAVNDEFGALEMFLRHLPSCLKAGGRAAILTFHSGEDRRVKQAFREGMRTGIYSATSDEVIRAGPEERRANPRSSSAKLRWAVRA